MKKIYALLAGLLPAVFVFSQVVLPLDFEANIEYPITNFEGGVLTVITNPQSSGINTSPKVARMVKNAGQVYAGSLITLTAPIDFGSNNKTFKMKVYSPRVGAKVLLKIENLNNAGIFFQKEVFTTVANTWEELTFDYTLVNTADSYQKIIFIFDNGTQGDGSANYTWLLDDVRLVSSGVIVPKPVLPVEFETEGLNYTFSDFEGGMATREDNPFKTGINTSNKVAKMVKGTGAVYAGSSLFLESPINFNTNKTFKMKVYSPRVGAQVLLKVENAGNSGQFFEKQASTTTANTWEDLTFDYSGINTANQYSKLVFIFDNGIAGDGSANFTFYFDDIRLITESGGLTQMNLPVTFDDPGVNYGLIGFEGAENSTIVVDPTDANNKVGKAVKSNTAQTYAGTTVSAAGGSGFSSKIPFTQGNAKMSVRVWTPHAPIQVRLKVEDSNDPTKSVETEATATVASGWQTLTFNFANQANGTAAINYGYNYNKATIFFNFGVNGATAGERTYYFDDIIFGEAPLPVSLLKFDAAAGAQGVVLNWQTATETNNLGFEVQRSNDGNRFTPLQFVDGKGNSNTLQSYSVLDNAPAEGLNYYRLKQIDQDGRFTFSAVKLINWNSNQQLVLYPNPAHGRVMVSMANTTGSLNYTIYNANGQRMATGVAPATNGTAVLDVQKLMPGTYLIQLDNGKMMRTTKLLVQ